MTSKDSWIIFAQTMFIVAIFLSIFFTFVLFPWIFFLFGFAVVAAMFTVILIGFINICMSAIKSL